MALGMLLPAGALRLPRGDVEQRPVVAGVVPEQLEGKVSRREQAPSELLEGPPLTVRTRNLGPGLRELLVATEPQPAVELRLGEVEPLRLPDRAVLVVLLAISLLTGPLAETLPGEREGRTLEVLLSTSLSRGEIVVGKWLAWTGLASAAALLSGVGGMLTGALSVGPWLVAMPAALGVAVALGLWLVRGAADLVGGAAAPMRVLPVVAVGTAGLAWGLAGGSPLLGAVVPLGGALVVAGGMLPGAGPLLAALAGSGALTAVLLRATTRALDQQGVLPRDRGGRAWATLAFGALCWWLAVAGPAVFALGGTLDLPAPPGASLAAGGLLLALVGAVAMMREGRAPTWGSWRGLPRGVVIGLALAFTSLGLGSLGGPDLALPFRVRLEAALTPMYGGVPAAVLVALGQEVLFRGALQRRLGLVATALAWVLVVMPMDPVRGLLIGLSLGFLQQRYGLASVLAAHLTWALLAGRLPAGGPAFADLLLCGLAVLLAALPARRG